LRGETLFFCRQCGIINPDGGEPPITFFREIVSMESLRELYRIGRGPSSSHTMGPASAAARFREAFPQADSFQVTLYGSLAKTGRGHLTDVAVKDALAPYNTCVVFHTEAAELRHPNTMDLEAFRGGERLGGWRVYSVGGGKIEIEGQPSTAPQDVYSLSTFSQIRAYCEERDLRLWQFVEESEGPEIWNYLMDVWKQMKAAVYAGLHTEGVLRGGLSVQRKAKYLIRQRHIDESAETRENRIVCAYAFAVSEENAGGGVIVTAPTCGASGVVPAVMVYKQEQQGFSDTEMVRGLAAAGIIGNLIKTNASISGAECGCQAEIGSACSMAAAGLAELFGMDLDQIEYAAEVAMEHHLGLTCDPIGGLVQIPCIERNAVAAMRAINALSLANFLTHTRKISFDMVVKTMYETGRDLFSKYRETSEGGLAKMYAE
jgi:L-serine dehydratase